MLIFLTKISPGRVFHSDGSSPRCNCLGNASSLVQAFLATPVAPDSAGLGSSWKLAFRSLGHRVSLGQLPLLTTAPLHLLVMSGFQDFILIPSRFLFWATIS